MAASPTSGGTSAVLPRERARASFDVQQLLKLTRGGNRGALVEEFHPKFSKAREGAEDDVYRSYEDLFRSRMKRMAEAAKAIRANPKFMAEHMKQKVSIGVNMEVEPTMLGIHFVMFLPFVETQSSEEQKKAWLMKARQGRYWGAYAQTELGHGSNVRGLETTATFDRATDEFVIHSPTLTSMKWWPTGMYACTHGVVFARLIIDGKDYGFHGFMVQFRDDDGRMMPGVEVGEIGPKIAKTHINIGYARFTHVRIPRFNMFARAQQVDRDGKYTAAPKKLNKFKYISMMHVRVRIVRWSYASLSRAATIATRYSAVRVQGFKLPDAENPFEAGEQTVLDYQMQQYRLFKAISLSYMFFWNGKYIQDYLRRIQEAVMKGGEAADAAADEMPELHATLSGLKVWSSLYAHDSMEDCRKSCGGQGFLLSSGIAHLPNDFAEPVTVEGEQVILSLQTARFLIKASTDVRAGRKVAGSVTYLNDSPLGRLNVDDYAGKHELVLSLFRDRASRFAHELARDIEEQQAAGKNFDDALNAVATQGYKCAECHSMFVMIRNNLLSLQDYVKDAAARAALLRCWEFLALTLVHEQAGNWIDVLDSTQLRRIKKRINALLAEIRPDAVALVDGFGWADKDLKSTLGRHDGNVYEAIYAQAKSGKLNQSPVMVGWEHLREIVDLDFIRAGMKTQRAQL